jgi:hypothetical protein
VGSPEFDKIELQSLLQGPRVELRRLKAICFSDSGVIQMDTNQQPRPFFPVKRLFIRSFAWGAGCGLVLVVVLAAVKLYEARPKTWDSRALSVKHAEAGAFVRLNEKLEEVSSGITFTVDVENTTTADVTLPRTLTIMEQKHGSHALHNSSLKLGADYFLPAHHVTAISLESDELCAANHPPQQCFDRYFKGDEDFVIFDEPQKFEAVIPVPTLTLPRGKTVSPTGR